MVYDFGSQVGADGTHRVSNELTVFCEHLNYFRVCVCVKSDLASMARLRAS